MKQCAKGATDSTVGQKLMNGEWDHVMMANLHRIGF